MTDMLDPEKFKRIKTRVETIVGQQAKVKRMFKDLADMYWIAETGAGPGNSSLTIRTPDGIGDDEVRLTASTTARDKLTGLHRLLRTSKPKFTARCRDKNYASRIETALATWWEASNARKRAKNESELTLSGFLWSDENLSVTKVDDMITVIQNAQAEGDDSNLLKVRLNRLKDVRKHTPFLFETESALTAYPVWGEDGKSEHVTRTTIKGRMLKERWGATGDIKDDQNYTLNDYWSLNLRCVYYDDVQLIGGEHDLPDIPRFSTVADGTELFPEEERKRQPLLYGWLKSNMSKREDEALTILFTSIYERGAGGLVLIDKDSPGFQEDDIDVDYKGFVRYFASHGNPRFIDDKAFDGMFIQLLQLLSSKGEMTTVNQQTLGEDIGKYTAYSGYAQAAQTGRVVLVGVQEATEKVIHDAAMYALRLLKEETIAWDGLKPDEILDDLELEVHLEVDLPQDKLRNAQTLAQLKGAGIRVSEEWVFEQLQIHDAQKMVHDWMSEQAEQAAYMQDLPALIPQLLQMMLGQAGGPPPPPGAPPGYQPSPNPDNSLQYTGQVGGPEAAAAGGAVTPAEVPQGG